RVAKPGRGAEIIADAAVHLEPAREAERQAVLKILQRVVDVSAEAVGRVVLRVAVVAEVDAELVAVFVVEADPRELILQLAGRRHRVAGQRRAGRTAGSTRRPFHRGTSSSRAP